MKQRLIASGLVFAVGFTIGLGLTWALLGDQPDGDPSDLTAAAEGDQLADDDEPAPIEAAEPANAADAPEPDADQQGEDEVAGDDAPAGEEPAQNEPAAADPPAQGEPADEAPAADEPTADSPALKSNAWWKGLEGKRRKVDMGQTKALSIRKGTIKDGEKLDWSKRFGTAGRIGLLYAAEENIVTVHAVAVNAAGNPVAAQITLEKQGKETTGVIALHTQGLKVSLVAVDGTHKGQ